MTRKLRGTGPYAVSMHRRLLPLAGLLQDLADTQFQ